MAGPTPPLCVVLLTPGWRRACVLSLALALTLGACAHHSSGPTADTATAAAKAAQSSSDATQPATTEWRPVEDLPVPLLLVSIDGFRYDYLDVFEPPNLLALAESGARAERLIPSFPTKTFPNHYTLVTGLVPDRHGIVSNNIVDPELGRFSLGNRDAVSDGRWWQGTPIWVTAQEQGLRTAAMFWPGSEAEINGRRPDFWMTYDDDLPGQDRLDHLVDWLSLPPAERPRFATLYFSRVDSASHRYAPLSHQARTAVMEVDELIGELRARLEEINQPVNWVVVSDHGMSETAPDRVIFVDDYVDVTQFDVIDLSPVLTIAPAHGASPEKGWERKVVQSLNGNPNLAAYSKGDLPAHLQHGKHPRVAPVVALANEGWRFSIRAREAGRPQRRYGGQHGYDPTLDSMGGLFVTAGPGIKATELGPIPNVDVYSLLCALLDVDPVPNDGSLASLRAALK